MGPVLGDLGRLGLCRCRQDGRRASVCGDSLGRDETPPDRLGPALSTYGVWIVPPGGAPIPAGRLAYDPANRFGQLTTVTPYEDFRVIVSAEPSVQMGAPSEAIVVSQDVQG